VGSLFLVEGELRMVVLQDLSSRQGVNWVAHAECPATRHPALERSPTENNYRLTMEWNRGLARALRYGVYERFSSGPSRQL
jgi:hypothetical protein